MTSKEILEERWHMATRDVQRFAGESRVSTINSERWTTINDTLEELGALLVEEADYDELLPLTEGIWQEIHDRMLTWAETIEAERDARRKAAAA